MKKRNEIILFILISILILININQQSNIRSLENRLTNMSNEIRSVSYSIKDLNSLMNQATQKNKLVHSYEIDIENLDEEYKDVNVSINVDFNELSIDSKVYLAYRESAIYPEDYYYETNDKQKLIHEEGKWLKVEMNSIDDIKYKAVFKGSYENDYDIKVLVEDNEVIKTEQISRVDLFSKLRSRIDIEVRPNSWSSTGQIEYYVQLFEHKFDEKIKLVSAVSKLYYNDKVIEEVDILKQTSDKMIDEPHINIWEFTKKVNVDVSESEGLENNNFRIEVIVEDSLGNIYSKTWRENMH